MLHNDTGAHQRWRRRAITVIGLGIAMVVALAAPALAHPTFPNDAPGFPNPQGSTTNPYSAGSRPTLNMMVEFEQDGVIFNGAVNTTVDVQVTVPAGWTNPDCGAASTSVGNSQVGTVVPGWKCTIETVSGHKVLHWHGPQVSTTQTEADSAQFFTFPVTVPSPITTTSYGATGSPAEGFYVKQTYADGTIAPFRSPNDTTRPGEEAPGLVRTVAGTQTPTQTTLQVFPVTTLHLAVSVVAVSPQDATGTVQLQDGTTTLGDPQPLTDGFAIIIRPLPPGPHSLTAMFTPRNPRKFGPSTTPNPVAFTF